MKRFSMAMTWLALAGLMTTVSCRKPVVGFTNGESRTVTISAATENGDGSKTAIDGLNVKWSENDQIKMNAESVLTLTEGAGSTMGRFAGEVKGVGPYRIGYPAGKTTYDGETLKLSIQAEWTYNVEKQEVPMVAYAEKVGDDVQFRNAVNMLKLQLKGVGADDNANKLKRIVLTSTTSNLSGDISVEFDGEGNPTFNAITDGEGLGKTMTVSFGDGLQLDETVQCVYIPLAKINGGDLTVRFDCANGIYVEKKVTATEAFNAVNNMLDCGEVTVRAVPKFSVGKDGSGNPITVEFSPGNLYWDGGAFRFEANQWDTKPAYSETEEGYGTWDPSHVSHFKWSDEANAVTSDDSYIDDLFCANNFTVAGDSHTWRTLSKAEWDYLLNTRDNASSLRAWKELDGGTNKGLVILPDGTDASVMSSITTTEALASRGAVFLPASGERNGTDVYNVGLCGEYWSRTPREGNEGYAYGMYFDSDYVYTGHDIRRIGYAVRLVR